jgi:hypothetical protein
MHICCSSMLVVSMEGNKIISIYLEAACSSIICNMSLECRSCLYYWLHKFPTIVRAWQLLSSPHWFGVFALWGRHLKSLLLVDWGLGFLGFFWEFSLVFGSLISPGGFLLRIQSDVWVIDFPWRELTRDAMWTLIHYPPVFN